jgi:hypothetical protein
MNSNSTAPCSSAWLHNTWPYCAQFNVLLFCRFDVILIDPPWEEYVRRAPGFVSDTDFWTWQEIQNLDIGAIADGPSFVFL